VKEIYGTPMATKKENLVALFKKEGGTLRFSVILKAGFHPDTLSALERQRSVEKIGWGLYRLKAEKPIENPDLVMVMLKAPRATVCLISALAFHEATDEIPRQIDLAIPRGSHANKIDYPPVRYYRLTQEAWEAGRQKHLIENQAIYVYSLAKTVADCFKFRNRMGINVARAALKTALTEKKVSPKEIMKYAKICKVTNVIKPVLEAML
jgi:predicted transcriptional regulator of viral defense system